jgi:hypothetical protein
LFISIKQFYKSKMVLKERFVPTMPLPTCHQSEPFKFHGPTSFTGAARLRCLLGPCIYRQFTTIPRIMPRPCRVILTTAPEGNSVGYTDDAKQNVLTATPDSSLAALTTTFTYDATFNKVQSRNIEISGVQSVSNLLLSLRPPLKDAPPTATIGSRIANHLSPRIPWRPSAAPTKTPP